MAALAARDAAGIVPDEIMGMARAFMESRVLLNALVALGLLTKSGDAYAPTPAAARYLARGARDDSVDALLHQASLWNTWSGLTETVRTGRPAPRPEMADRGDDWTVAFIAAMH